MHKKIVFSLEKITEDFPPFAEEAIVVEELAHGVGKVVSIPLFVRSLSRGDIVEFANDGECDRFVSSLGHSGSSTFRIMLHNDRYAPVVETEIPAMGCAMQSSSIPGYYAVDVPRDSNFSEVRDYLIRAANRGVLDFEEGCISLEHQPR